MPGGKDEQLETQENKGRKVSQKAKGGQKFKRCQSSADASGYGFDKMEVPREFSGSDFSKKSEDGVVEIADCYREGIKGGSGGSTHHYSNEARSSLLEGLKAVSVISQRTVSSSRSP